MPQTLCRVSLREARRRSAGTVVALEGWVRSVRKHKRVAFLELNDGSSAENMQVVAGGGALDHVSTGASVRVEGALAVVSFRAWAWAKSLTRGGRL